MKKLTHLLVALLLAGALNAQTPTATTTAFSKAVETILGDFPHNYKHITGELLLAQGEWEHYASTITLPGAQSCIVARYHSVLDTTASWTAQMFSSENFEQAAAEYKRLYTRLNSCKIKMVDGSVYYLDGDYEAASESLDFVTSTLKVKTADERFRQFKIELELLYKMDEWVININMVSKKKDADMRPDWWTGN